MTVKVHLPFLSLEHTQQLRPRTIRLPLQIKKRQMLSEMQKLRHTWKKVRWKSISSYHDAAPPP